MADVSLNLKIKTTEHFIVVEREYVKIIVDVTAKGKDIKGAIVSFSIKSGGTGTFTVTSGTTDKSGLVETRFTADEVGYYTIEITASKSPFTDGTKEVLILSYAEPTEYSTNGYVYLSFIEQKKVDILKILSSVLDRSDDFYLTTGASDRITYLTEWNYQIRDFPLLVMSSGGASHQPSGINPLIDNQTRGDFVKVPFMLNVIAENKNILDRLTERCIWILGTSEFYTLYGKYGIYVIRDSIITAGVVTEPYGSRYLFANKISFTAKMEMVYTINANNIIEDITVEENAT